MMKKILFCFLIMSVLGMQTLFAQHLDEIHFGNSTSELSHGLTSFDMSKSETYVGLQEQSARRFLPDITNPFAGIYPGIYGGEVTFVMKVDGTKQNYFTGKFSGSESNSGRILLEVEGKELGHRHLDSEELFLSNIGAVAPGAFVYRTAPIPRSLTDGKKEITIRLRSSGYYYYYGSPGNYPSYQRNLTAPTCGIYGAYSHTDPGFKLPDTDVQGQMPSYSNAPKNVFTSIATIREATIANGISYFAGILNGSDFIPTDQNNYFNPIEALAEAYFRPEITNVYQNPAVITKLYKLIDNLAVNHYNGTYPAKASWGGAFGRPAYAVFLLYDLLDQTKLDEVVDLGGGANRSRRSQWCEIFKASFDYAVVNRKSITNQEMELGVSVYGATLGLNKLDPATYGTYPAIGLRFAQESCGLEEFTGNATNLATNNPTLGNPAASAKGAGYYFVTLKGTSHEPGWVAPDCYGDLGHQFVHMYGMSKHHLGSNADIRFLERGVLHAKSQSLMTYAYVGADGNKDILGDGYICVRNVYVPGERFYTNPLVAGVTKNDTLLGYMAQMLQDGRLDALPVANFKTSNSLYFLDLLNALESYTGTTSLPSSPDQPDYFFADEENGVVTIKNSGERISFNMFYRATSDNKLVRGHLITPTHERFLEFRAQHTEFRSTGSFLTRSQTVSALQWSGEAPDKPLNGYGGQQDEIPVGYAILDLYQVAYGNYFIAMNTTKDINKTIIFPSELVGKSAINLSTGQTVTLPARMAIQPLTTFVFKVSDNTTAAGLIAENAVTTDKSIAAARVTELETFAQLPATVANVTVIPEEGKYKYDNFNFFIRSLSFAKFMVYDTTVNQDEVDGSLVSLNAAYQKLIGDLYVYDPVIIPDVIDFSKRTSSSGTILFESYVEKGYVIGSTKKNATVTVPVKATTTGIYKITISASTTRAASALPQLNLDFYDHGTNFANVVLNTANTQSITTSAVWTDFNDYVWYRAFTADEVKLMRLHFYVNDAGWATNVREVKFELLNPWEELQMDIDKAQTLLSNYSNSATAYYSKVNDETRGLFSTAIATAQAVPETAALEEVAIARQVLTTANQNFLNAISPISMVKGLFDFNIYERTSGSIIVSAGTFSKPATLDSTKNNAYIVLPFKAWADGTYLPSISASTNTDATSNPRVNLQVFESTDNIATTALNTANSVMVQKFGWTVFNTYNFPTVSLVANKQYYLKVTFLTGATWAVGVNKIGMQPLTPFQELQIDIQSATTLLANYSDSKTAYYSKVTDASRSMFANAITAVQPIQETATVEEITAARQVLSTARQTFLDSVSAVSMVKGLFDFNISERTSGTNIIVDTGSFTKPAAIGSTKNNAYIVLPFKAWEDGYYIPNILASTNTDAIYNPRVNLEVFESTDNIVTAVTNATNSVMVQKLGLAVFSSYNLPKVKLYANKQYYLRVKFLTGTTWSANVSQIAFNLAEKLNQTISFNSLDSKMIDAADFTLNATASSGLPVSYESSNINVATITNGLVHIVGAGTTEITASQAGDGFYANATPVTHTLIVMKKNQNITFNSLETKVLGDFDFGDIATASSGLTVSYSSSNPAVATVIDGKIHIVGTGSTNIAASQSGDNIYNPALDVAQTLKVISTLKVKYKDGDNNLTNNQIRPNLTIYNEGNIVIPYSELTLRYWLTPENYAGINTWIDYAQIGSDKVKMKYVSLPDARNGAYGYIEYSFKSSAGNLLAGANSGLIQSRLANTNWSNLNESNDYSYVNSNTLTYNEYVTMYRNGQLVWGIEPLIIPAIIDLKVYTETKSNPTTNSISTYLKINNEGNVPVAYGDVKVRYWFTREGTANLNYYLDYAVLGNSNIQSVFTSVNPSLAGTDTYLELGVKADLGTFYPSSSTGNIQYRIAKSDWTNFNQTNDYSYNTNTTMVLNSKVTVYYKGELIYGTEPVVASNNKVLKDQEKYLVNQSLNSNLNQLEDVTVYPNPVLNDLTVEINELSSNAKLELFTVSGTKLRTQAFKSTTQKISFEGLPSGIYRLYITNGTEIIVKNILKK